MPVVTFFASLDLDPICLFLDEHKLGSDLSASKDLGDEHPVTLPVGPDEEIGGAGFGKTGLRVKGDGTGIPFPGTQPPIFSKAVARGSMNLWLALCMGRRESDASVAQR